MEDYVKTIKERSALLDGYAAVIEELMRQVRYYQHTDDDGNIVDDEDDWSTGRRNAFKNAIEAVMKLAK